VLRRENLRAKEVLRYQVRRGPYPRKATRSPGMVSVERVVSLWGTLCVRLIGRTMPPTFPAWCRECRGHRTIYFTRVGFPPTPCGSARLRVVAAVFCAGVIFAASLAGRHFG